MSGVSKKGGREGTRISRPYKTTVIFLLALRPMGILLHSIVLWVANRFFSLGGSPPAQDPAAAFRTRFSVLQIGRAANEICATAFLVGCLVLLYYFVRKSPFIPFHKLFFPFVAAAIALFLCAFPFILLDPSSWGDYLFPIWSALVVMAMLSAAFLLADLMKKVQRR